MTDTTEAASTEVAFPVPKEAIELAQAVAALRDRVPGELKIETRDQAAKATAALGQAKSLMKGSETDRKKLVGPLNDEVRHINASFKEQQGPLQEIIDVLDAGIKEYMAEEQRRERERQEAEARAAREAAEAEARRAATLAALEGDDAPPEPAPLPEPVSRPMPRRATTITTGSGQASTRKQLKVEVTDIKALCRAVAEGSVPETAVEPNMKTLRALARVPANPEDLGIPGVRAFNDVAISVRSV